MLIHRHVETCDPTKLPVLKENSCLVCDKVFAYSSQLTRHLNIHQKKGEMMVPSFLSGNSSLQDNSSELALLDNTVNAAVGSSREPMSLLNSTAILDVHPTLDLPSDVLAIPYENGDTTDVPLVDVLLVEDPPILVLPGDGSCVDFGIDQVGVPHVVSSDASHSATVDATRVASDVSQSVSVDTPPAVPVHVNLETDIYQMINDLSPNLVIDGPKKWKYLLTHTDAAGPKEADIYQCLIRLLQKRVHTRKGRGEFNSLLYDLFGHERLTDPSFLYFLANQLNKDYCNFKWQIDNWFRGGM